MINNFLDMIAQPNRNFEIKTYQTLCKPARLDVRIYTWAPKIEYEYGIFQMFRWTQKA